MRSVLFRTSSNENAFNTVLFSWRLASNTIAVSLAYQAVSRIITVAIYLSTSIMSRPSYARSVSVCRLGRNDLKTIWGMSASLWWEFGGMLAISFGNYYNPGTMWIHGHLRKSFCTDSISLLCGLHPNAQRSLTLLLIQESIQKSSILPSHRPHNNTLPKPKQHLYRYGCACAAQTESWL